MSEMRKDVGALMYAGSALSGLASVIKMVVSHQLGWLPVVALGLVYLGMLLRKD